MFPKTVIFMLPLWEQGSWYSQVAGVLIFSIFDVCTMQGPGDQRGEQLPSVSASFSEDFSTSQVSLQVLCDQDLDNEWLVFVEKHFDHFPLFYYFSTSLVILIPCDRDWLLMILIPRKWLLTWLVFGQALYDWSCVLIAWITSSNVKI